MRILTAEAMQAVDRAAIEELGIPSLVLMENAALGVVEAIGERFASAREVALFCGPGNNGGDGLAVARHLAVRGYGVRIFLATGGRQLRGDAGIQLAICRKMELPLVEIADAGELGEVAAAAGRADLLVDALFGTGLGRPLEGLFAELVALIGRLPAPVVAVDLPSGLAGGKSERIGPRVRADLTVTFAAPKLAHVFPPASEAVGELVVADLGVPPRLVEEAPGDLHWLAAEELAPLLPERPAAAHKGTFGHLLILAGGPGRAGAVVMAARSAVRSGAGLVTAAVPAPIRDAVDVGSLESMTLALPADDDGELAGDAAAAAVLAAARGKDALALGPGLGQGEATAATIRRVVLECPLPLVLDADGVNAFAGRHRELARRAGPTILTPHPGEAARLLGSDVPRGSDERLAAVRRAAAECGAVTVLKGHLTLVASPGGAVWVNPTGNPGMATGGSGDVLTGMIAALLAQGLESADAARAGVYLHGLAGDRAAERLGWVSLAASDLLEELPGAFRSLAES